MTSDATRGRAGRSPALLGAVGLLGFVALFEALTRVGVLPREYFPAPSDIATAMVVVAGEKTFWIAFGVTVQTWAIGLAIAVVGGLVLGLVIGLVPFLRSFTASTVEFLRPIPSVALIPLVTMLVGLEMTSVVVLVVYASFWQMLVQVLYGVSDVDPVARETARSYRLGWWHQVRYVVWPTTLPYAMTGVRLAVAVALILAVTGELLFSQVGLGHDIDVAFSSNTPDRAYALIVVVGLIGVAANLLTRVAERFVLAWHPSVRSEVPV